MKTSRIAALALIATAAAGFNAYAGETSDRYEPATAQTSVSTFSRAQVQAEAVQAARESFQRGYNYEIGEYVLSAPVQSSDVGLSREAVRAEAIKARNMQPSNESAS